MKWKKLDLRRFEGGCFVNSARPIPHLDHNGHGHDDGGGGVDGDGDDVG